MIAMIKSLAQSEIPTMMSIAPQWSFTQPAIARVKDQTGRLYLFLVVFSELNQAESNRPATTKEWSLVDLGEARTKRSQKFVTANMPFLPVVSLNSQ